MEESRRPGAPATSNDAAPHFAKWLRAQLVRRGYDLSRPRSGGRGQFAHDSGIPASTVSRLLGGDRTPDIRSLQLLAQALRLPLGEVLVRAGVLDSDDLQAVQHPVTGDRRITPEQAADELGIDDPQARRVFIATTETLQRQPPPSTHGENIADT